MKRIIILIMMLASIGVYSQSLNLNNNKIRIVDSTMGLGITPTSRLHVFGNGTASGLLNITNDKDATKDSSVVIDAIGNVGIGKETPTAKLYVQDTTSSIGGSIPVAYIRAAKPNKIALGAVSISGGNEIHPDYNIGLYASSRGGTNNFAGYFNGGDVYIDNNLGIGRLAPTYRLDVFGNGGATDLMKISNDINSTYDSTFVVNKDGNVGIGVSAPTSKLEVANGYNSHLGSEPLAYFKAATNDKIAVLGSAVTDLSETFPDYNIGLYGTAHGGTNNFAGYFKLGNVYVNENLGIGTTTPAAALHIKGGSERLGVVTYSTLDSTHLSTQDVRCTDTIKTSGTFYYDNAGSTLSINTAYGIKVYGFSTIDKDSLLIQDFGTTLSDNEAYSLPTNLSWKGEIDVDSLGYTLFTAQIRCDANGTPYLEGVSWKRWSSKTYVEVGSTDGYFNIYDAGSGMAIKNSLGYTIKATLRFRTKQ